MKDKKPQLYSTKNERAKYSYRQHLRRVSKKDEITILAALKHIRVFEAFAHFAGFENFNADVADKYIQSLFQQQTQIGRYQTQKEAAQYFGISESTVSRKLAEMKDGANN